MSSKIDLDKIAEHMKENRWNASRIAEKAGISIKAVTTTLNGKHTPTATNLKAICDTIGLPIEEAFTEEA